MSHNSILDGVPKLKKILISIPTQEMARYAEFYDWVDLLHKPEDAEVYMMRAHGQSPARNRNLGCKQAIETGCDYIFFIDDDCIVPPDTLLKLLKHDKDVVTGLYCMRNYPHRPIVFDVANNDGTCAWTNLNDSEEGLKEIVATGLGACLIKVDVLKKISETEKYWVTLGELEPDGWCDDLSFFKRVRKAGYKIFVDLDSPVGHIAKSVVWPNKIDGKWNITYETGGTGRASFPMERIVYTSAKMRAPSEKRDTTYRQGVMQIHITNICNLTCPNCSQGCNLQTHPQSMTLDQFETAIKSVQDYYGVIGIYGGNPTMHHRFAEICEILRAYIPLEQRGLFTNSLSGHGAICRDTFNPAYSNLNIHADMKAYDEFKRDWPEALFNVKGFNHSRHSAVWAAIGDMEDMTDKERWETILTCDVNKYWSAMVGLFRGEIRGWFCEIAGAQSRLHEDEPDYPDTGLPINTGWWKKPISQFQHQVEKHCYSCGIPLRGMGDLDNGTTEYVSKSHISIYKLKHSSGKIIKLVRNRSELGGTVPRATDYVENGQLELTTR